MDVKVYTNEEITSLISRFVESKLPKVEWTHEAHLIMAVWFAKHYPDNAMDMVRDLITKHNESVGTPNTDTEGYHETITQFWMMTVKTFMLLHTNQDVAFICNELINSEQGRSDYPLRFYSSERLFSTEARHNWVKP